MNRHKLLREIFGHFPEERECIFCKGDVEEYEQFCFSCGKRNLRFNATEENLGFLEKEKEECKSGHSFFFAKIEEEKKQGSGQKHQPEEKDFFCPICGEQLIFVPPRVQ